MRPAGNTMAATKATHSNLVAVALSSMLRPSPVFCPVFLPLCHDEGPPAILGLEGGVNWDPIAIGKPIGLVGHSGHGHQLPKHILGHARLSGSSRMTGDAIPTAIGHADREVDHFFHERIERTRRHHLFYAFPCALEGHWIARKVFPEIIHVRHIPGLLDVVIDLAHLRRSIGIFDWGGCWHSSLLHRPYCHCRASPRNP